MICSGTAGRPRFTPEVKAVCFRVMRTATLTIVTVFGLISSRASAVLVPSPDGKTVYDTATNVTWLADANLSATATFGLPVCNGASAQPCINPSGSMTYPSAVAWVNAMNTATYLGHSNWQLPTNPTNDPGCLLNNNLSFGFNCSASALGSLYYSALALRAPDTAVPGVGSNAGPFANFQPYLYWSQTVDAKVPRSYHTFSFRHRVLG